MTVKRSDQRMAAAKEHATELLDRIFADDSPLPSSATEMMNNVLHESDRGCVLVSAAHLDEALEDLLRARFSENPQILRRAVNPLLSEGLAPIKSLSSRLKLAYALELIEHETFSIIDGIRKLRNEFAHQSGPTTLASERVKPILDRLPLHEQVLARAFGSWVADELAELEHASRAIRAEGERSIIRSGLSSERAQFTLAFMFSYSEIRREHNLLSETIV